MKAIAVVKEMPACQRGREDADVPRILIRPLRLPEWSDKHVTRRWCNPNRTGRRTVLDAGGTAGGRRR